MIFKGNKNKWKSITHEVDGINGTMFTKIYTGGNNSVVNVICRVTATHREEGMHNAILIENAPEMLAELIRLQTEKPRHPEHPDSKYKSKSDYDRAYKKWRRTQDVIEKALGVKP